jgi:hypothetical protein
VSISPVASITEFDVFTGASSGTNGLPGQVPKPEAGQEGFYLRGDGTWAAVSATGGGGGAPTDAQYFVLSANATLTQERLLTFGSAFTASDAGAGAAYTISLASQIAAAGPIGSGTAVPVITYNAAGQLTTVTTAAITASGISAVPVSRVIYASGALTGGGDLSADRTISLASIITATNVGSSTVVPVLTIDAFGRITFATTATITASGGGGGGVNSVQGTVDFGFATGQEGDIATVTVTATWVSSGSVLVCSPAGVATADHDPDDYYCESIQAYPSDIVAGTGFNINARAPFGSWGRYVINAVG